MVGKIGIGVICSVIAACALLILSPHGQLALTDDSLHYLATAWQVEHGFGLTIPTLQLFGPAVTAMTDWPPLYPVTLSASSYLGVSPLWLHVILLGILIGILFRTYSNSLNLKYPLAALAALVSGLSMPVLIVASYAWSGLLCIVLVVLAFSLSLEIRKDRIWLPWSLAIACIVFASYTRYIAFFFCIALAVAILASDIRKKLRFYLAAASPLIVGLAWLPLLIRNWELTGFFSGMKRPPSSLSLGQNVSLLWTDLSTLFTPPFRFTTASVVYQAVFVLSGISLVVFLGYLIKKAREEHVVPGARAAARFSAHAILWVGLYLITLVGLRTWRSFDNLDFRLIAPSIPFLMMALLGFIAYVANLNAKGVEKSLLVVPALSLVILSSIQTITDYSQAWQSWRTNDTPTWRASAATRYRAFTHWHLSWPSGKPTLLGGHAFVLRYQLNANVFFIPAPPYSLRKLEQIIKRADGIVLDDRSSAHLVDLMITKIPHFREDTYLVSYRRLYVVFWRKPHSDDRRVTSVNLQRTVAITDARSSQ